MTGLYTSPSEDSFRDDQTIKRDLYLSGHYPDPIKETPLPQDRDFTYWSGRFRERQQAYVETTERTDHAVIQFHDTTCLNFIGDIHAGSAETDYERLEREIQVITNTPNSYVVLLGDVIDGYFFGEDQYAEIEQVPEQINYYRALLMHLSQHKKLLVGYGGDHCNWAAKMGHSANARFARDTGAYYMNGVGYITAKVCDQVYNITAEHRPQGHSIHSNTYPAYRLGKDVEGSDIIITAHTHQKGLNQQTTREFGGDGRVVTYGSVGPYKKTDKYSQKMGFADIPEKALYGFALILDKDEKSVDTQWSILKANALMGAR